MSNMSELDLRLRAIEQRLTSLEQDNELLRKEVGWLKERPGIDGVVNLITIIGRRIDNLWEYINAE